MTTNNQTITGSVNYDAPTITPMDCFSELIVTQSGELEYNLKTTKPCTII